MHDCKNACGPCSFYVPVWHHCKPVLAVWQGTCEFRSWNQQMFIASVFRSPNSMRSLTMNLVQGISWGCSENCPQRLWSPKRQHIRLWLPSQDGLYHLLWRDMKTLAIVKVFWACNIKNQFTTQCVMNVRCFCRCSPGSHYTTWLQPQFWIDSICTLSCVCCHTAQR